MFKFTFVSVFFLFATLSSLVFTFPIEPRGISGFKADLNTLSGKIDDLYNTLGSVGDSITIEQGLEIYNEVQAVEGALNQSNNDVKNIHSLSESDARDIVGTEKGFVMKFVDILNILIQKKNTFEPYASRIEEQLKTMHDGFMMLTGSLVKLAPSDIHSQAEDLKNKIDTAFVKAISEYSH